MAAKSVQKRKREETPEDTKRHRGGGGDDDVPLPLVDEEDSGGVQLFIKTLTGKSLIVNVPSLDMTVAELQALIGLKAVIPADTPQRLTFAGAQLNPEYNLLSDYNIQKESTFDLDLRLRGGMLHVSSGRDGLEDLETNKPKSESFDLQLHYEDKEYTLFVYSSVLPVRTLIETFAEEIGVRDTSILRFWVEKRRLYPSGSLRGRGIHGPCSIVVEKTEFPNA